MIEQSKQFLSELLNAHQLDQSSPPTAEEWQAFISDLQQIVDLPKPDETRLTAIVNERVGIIEWNRDFKVRNWNMAAERIFGYSIDEAVGQHAKFILTEEVWPIVDEVWKHLKQQTGGERSTNLNRTKDGHIITCDWYNTRVLDETGQVIGVVSVVADITKQQALEDEVERRGLFLNLVLDAIPQTVFWKDRDLNYLGCNRQFAADAGLDNPELIVGLNDHDMPWVDIAHLYQTDDQSVIDSGRAKLNIEEPITKADGSHGWLRTNKIPLRDIDQEVIGVLGTYEDVTEQVTAQQELRQSEKRLNQLVAQSPVGIIEWDTNFCVARWNIAAERIFGYTAAEAMGKHAKFILTEEVWPIVDQIWAYLQQQVGGERSTNINITKEGREITCDWYNSRILDEDGSVASVISMVADITDRVEDERQIRYQSQILENVREAIIATDLDFVITSWNKEAEEMYGYSASEVLGQPLSDYIETRYYTLSPSEAREQIFSNGYINDRAVQKIANGRELVILASASLLRDSDGSPIGLVGINRDITAAEQAQTERDRLNRILENSIDFVALFAPDGQLEFLNQAGYEMIGRDRNEDIRNLSIADAIPGWAVSLIYDTAIPTVLESGKWTGEISILNRDGRETPVSLVLIAHQESTDGHIRISAIGRDISVRIDFENQTKESLARRSQQVEITTQIAQEVATTDDLNELYQRVVDLIKETFGYYHTQLLRYNPALNAMSLVAGYGEVGHIMRNSNHTMPMGTGLIGTAAATGRAVLQTNVRVNPNWQPNPLLPQTTSELAVPIKFNDDVLGVLDIQSDESLELTPEDQVLMEGLCGQVAIAIESVRLQQDMADRLEELSHLQQLMSQEGWTQYQSKIGETTGYLYDQSATLPIGNSQGTHSNGGQSNLDAGILTSSSSGRLITNAITVRGAEIGRLGVQDSPDQPLKPEEISLLNEISQQVADALENARLIEQTYKRARELETVARVSATTSTILETGQLLSSVADLTKESFNLYHAHIYLADESRNSLILAAGAGEIGTLLMAEGWEIPLSSTKSLVALSARHRRGFMSQNVTLDDHYLPNPLLPFTKSELAVPMIAGDRLLGVLDLQADTINAFTDEDLQIHTTLATQVAIALQNATLYEEQLQTADKLRDLDRLKSEFLASMSHELRTPLNSIIGFADVLLEGIDGELNERMEEDVLLIRDSGQHLRNLIGDILDMSKIEAGMMDLSYDIVDLYRVSTEVMATTRGLVTGKPVNVIMDVPNDIGVAEADRTRLVQILLNLLSNAAKFTDEGSVTLTMSREETHVLVAVEDTGVGIKPEDIAQVFEQFRQIGGIEHRKAGGTGLGMPITKQLVELHGGKIWIESTYGEGTTFWFTLPNRDSIEMPINITDGYFSKS